MALGSPTMWLLIAWAAASATLIALGVESRRRERRGLGALFTAGGILVTLAPLWALVYSFSPLSNPTSMFVEGLDPPNDPWFTVELRHTSTFHDGTEYWLSAAGGPEHVASVFQAQHPDGVVTLDSVTADGASIWHLSTDDVRYELVHFSDPDSYSLATQAVVVHPSGSGPDMRIPFPRSAFAVTAVDEGEPYANSWSQDQWSDFYADITKAHVNGDTITVPTNRGTTATIQIEDGLATVTLDD